MENVKYNGWTNYATWRIALEYFEDVDFENEVTAEYLRELVEEHLYEQGEGTCLDYALAFISEVNWYEIAEHLKD